LPSLRPPRSEDVLDLVNDADPEKAARLKMFVEEFAKLKEDKLFGLSNFTCLLRKIGMQTEEGEINMDFYRKGLWEGTDYSDEFKQANSKGYELCKTLSDALPDMEDALPIKKKFGKTLFFHKCTLESEMKVCLHKEVLDYIEEKYGSLDLDLAKKLGLPGDKYMAAFMKKLVMKHSMNPTVKAVMKFFHRGEGMLI